MFRALYTHNSKLPKYLSFEAGDKFTLIDTSVSDQWFLAQNGLGQIGYVPYNYIKKVETTTEQQVKFIDGAIEAIHLQAEDGNGCTQEQRLCLKKLVKHRADVIKRAAAREKSPKGVNKRRPAPAPPVEKTHDTSEGGERPSSLGIVGQKVTISTSSSDKQEAKKSHSKTLSSKTKEKEKKEQKDKGESQNIRTLSAASDVVSSNLDQEKNDVKKSHSEASSISHTPSVVSSASTDINWDAFSETPSKESELSLSINETSIESFEHLNTESDESNEKCTDPQSSSIKPVKEKESEQVVEGLSSSDQAHNQIPSFECQEIHCVDQDSSLFEVVEQNSHSNLKQKEDGLTPHESPAGDGGNDEIDDLPPPPSDLQVGGADDDVYFYSDYSYSLPPAPNDLLVGDEEGEAMEESGDSDSLDLPAAKAIRECSCDDVQPKFDSGGVFIASGSLSLPEGRQVHLRKKEKRDVEGIHSSLASIICSSSLSSSSSSPESVEQLEKELVRVEQVQACLGVTVTHADCEEMIGQLQHVSHLSHEESHWALLSAMRLFADNLPHIRPSLEILALRFKMAHQCPSTGKDYQCEDARTLESLVGQLDSVMNDSQQRGHYLEDDLGDIIDIITTLSETLSKAKPCVSVAAIQDNNYTMVEVIAKYYQMETRWMIHSCLLQLVEVICRLHPQAITEFLYSQLPLELVAEMQQNSHDDIRFLQVSRALGIVFMRGKASPHRLAMTMDLHFFIWLLGMIEGFSERCRHDDVETVVALVCAYHLQHHDDPQNPLTEALKMAQGHALLESSLSFLSKHGDPTRLLDSGMFPKVNSVILLLTHLYDSSDTADLLYTNDVDALIGIFEEVFRDLSSGESLHRQMLKLLSNFLRCYPDTVSIKSRLSSRLGPLLHDMKNGRCLARTILEHNKHIFEDL